MRVYVYDVRAKNVRLCRVRNTRSPLIRLSSFLRALLIFRSLTLLLLTNSSFFRLPNLENSINFLRTSLEFFQLPWPKEEAIWDTVELFAVVHLMCGRHPLEVRNFTNGSHRETPMHKSVVYKHIQHPKDGDTESRAIAEARNKAIIEEAIGNERNRWRRVDDRKGVIRLEGSNTWLMMGLMQFPEQRRVMPERSVSPERPELHGECGTGDKEERRTDFDPGQRVPGREETREASICTHKCQAGDAYREGNGGQKIGGLLFADPASLLSSRPRQRRRRSRR